MNRLIQKFIIIQAFSLLPVPAFSQKTVNVSGSAQVELTEIQSILEIKNRARELATIDALERAFGCKRQRAKSYGDSQPLASGNMAKA